MVNPHDALVSFQAALSDESITPQKCELDHALLVHLDMPMNRPRLTYVYVENGRVMAFSNLASCEPLNGKPCFQIGYAVPEDLRDNGWAKRVATAAIAEISNGWARNNQGEFYVEASVETSNCASLSVAQAIFGNPVKEGEDENSGQTVQIFQKKFGEPRSGL